MYSRMQPMRAPMSGVLMELSIKFVAMELCCMFDVVTAAGQLL